MNTNLVGIYAALAGISDQAVLDQYAGQGFGAFKPKLAELTVNAITPIGQELARVNADPAQIDAVLKDGAERASAIAAPIMEDVRRIIGFWGA